jgi:hypothetical protein
MGKEIMDISEGIASLGKEIIVLTYPRKPMGREISVMGKEIFLLPHPGKVMG